MCIEYYFVRKEVMSHIPFNALSRRWVNSCLLMTWDSFQPNQAAADVAVQNLESCSRELKAWMSADVLKLNDYKTETILFWIQDSAVQSLCQLHLCRRE